jgi:ethylene receptor
MATRGLLMCLGCEVTVVSSGQECLQVISQPGQSFNVLLLDVCMLDMDGYEVAIHIQEKFARHERRLLVALTANTDMATWERCLSLGMDWVILKPISLGKMQMVLTELLGFGSLNDNHWRT